MQVVEIDIETDILVTMPLLCDMSIVLFTFR